jgi:hypothetical protein
MFILVVIYILLLVFLCFRKYQVRTSYKTVTEPIITEPGPIIKEPSNISDNQMTENSNTENSNTENSNTENKFDINDHLNQDMLINFYKPVYPMQDAFILNF